MDGYNLLCIYCQGAQKSVELEHISRPYQKKNYLIKKHINYYLPDIDVQRPHLR